MLAKSRVTTLLLYRILETFFCIILKANPSAIADLPTPGSPINKGLFFFLLLNIWETLSISFSLPITGSSLPELANEVKSLPKLSKTGVLDLTLDLASDLIVKGFSSIGSSLSLDSSGNVSDVGELEKSSLSSVSIYLNCSLTDS